MFQESVRLSTGPRVQHCAPCSIIFQIKLIKAVFRAQWQCLGPTCQEILLCQCATTAKIFILDFWRICECHLLSQKPFGFLRWDLRSAVLHPPMPKSLLRFFFFPLLFFFIFVSTKCYLRQIPFRAAWTVVKPFSKLPTADLLLQFAFQPHTLSPSGDQYFNVPTISSQYICSCPIVT